MLEERTYRVPIGEGVPALEAIDPEQPTRGVVLVLHGLGAKKESQRPEIRRLARAGFRALAIDAPAHGERREPFLDTVLAETGRGVRDSFRRLLARAVAEIPLVIDWCAVEYGLPIGLAGISMGGHTTFCSLLQNPHPRVAVPIIGSPEYPVASGETPESARARLPRVPLLAVTAGRDSIVPPGRTREFIEALKPHYGNESERLRYLEFPESEHLMREADWKTAWEQITEWFVKWLPEPRT